MLAHTPKLLLGVNAPKRALTITLLAGGNFDPARVFGGLFPITPAAPVAGRHDLMTGRENSIFRDAPEARRLPGSRLQLRGGDLFELESAWRWIPVCVPAIPVAARTVLPGGTKLALHIEHPQLHGAVVTLASRQLVNLLGTVGAVPIRSLPTAPFATWCFLIDGVESAFEIDAPELSATVAALLGGGQFVEQCRRILPRHAEFSLVECGR